jgi:hypothetical protein
MNIKSQETKVNSHRQPLAPYSVLRYGIGGFGTGDTPQIADAQGGRGGVGISSPFPCLDGLALFPGATEALNALGGTLLRTTGAD